MSDILSQLLSSAEHERLDIAMAIIRHYARGEPLIHDLCLVFPDNINATLQSVLQLKEVSVSDTFSRNLFLRMIMADIRTEVVSGEKVDPTQYRLSEFFEFVIQVAVSVPALQMRCYVNLLTMFLSQVVVKTGVSDKMNLFLAIQDTVGALPELSFTRLYTTPTRIPESLDIGITLLRCLSNGYPLPNVDLAAELTCYGQPLTTPEELVKQLLDPGSEDIIVADSCAVIFSSSPSYQEERRQKLKERFAAENKFVLSDVIIAIVSAPYESERVAGFVLRRLADIGAQILNADTTTFSCQGHGDIYPWLIQCRKRYDIQNKSA